MERRNNAARRSTRLSLQIPVVVTSLDPACDFRKECKTVFVNAHGCGVIVGERLKDETPVMMKLVSNGASKKGMLCLPSRFLRAFHGCWEWSLTAQGTFGKSRIRRQIGASEGFRATIARIHRRHDALSLLIGRVGEGARITVARRKEPAKQKFQTFLQASVLLEKFHLFTVQLRRFEGE